MRRHARWALVLCAVWATGAQAGPIIHLGSLGGSSTQATDINNSNVVVGDASLAVGGTRGFQWTATGGIVPLIPATGTESSAEAINETGVIAGTTGGQAAKLSATSAPVLLGTLGGSLPLSVAHGINDLNHVVGYSQSTSGNVVSESAFVYRATPMMNMGKLANPSGAIAEATDINNAGQAVDFSTASDGTQHAFFYTQAGGITDLGAGAGSRAWSINESGSVAGEYLATSPVGNKPFAALPGGSVSLLALGVATSGRAFDINASNSVVGVAGGHAALWPDFQHVVDLDAWLKASDPADGANWTLTSAHAINDLNMIVGVGTYNDGAGGLPDGTRSYLLDASSVVPEPAALPLIGLAALVMSGRRRSRSGRRGIG